MNKTISSLKRILWELKWWWIIPLVLLAVLCIILVVTINITGGSPFVYELNANTTKAVFPEMPLTNLRDGLRASLKFYLETVECGELSESDLA